MEITEKMVERLKHRGSINNLELYWDVAISFIGTSTLFKQTSCKSFFYQTLSVYQIMQLFAYHFFYQTFSAYKIIIF